MSVLQLKKRLARRPIFQTPPGLDVRPYQSLADADAWLALREQAFEGENPSVRAWSQAEFRAEFLERPGWSPGRMWLAEALPHGPLLGAVSLCLRSAAAHTSPAVHWLMVAPAARRRGVGRLLLSSLEQACWDLGYRTLRLETHRGWETAVQFYRSQGFQAV